MKECWICGEEIKGEFAILEWYSDGEKKREYHLCGACRNVEYGELKRWRRRWKKDKARGIRND